LILPPAIPSNGCAGDAAATGDQLQISEKSRKIGVAVGLVLVSAMRYRT
jgi:hypothetical protein